MVVALMALAVAVVPLPLPLGPPCPSSPSGAGAGAGAAVTGALGAGLGLRAGARTGARTGAAGFAGAGVLALGAFRFLVSDRGGDWRSGLASLRTAPAVGSRPDRTGDPSLANGWRDLACEPPSPSRRCGSPALRSFAGVLSRAAGLAPFSASAGRVVPTSSLASPPVGFQIPVAASAEPLIARVSRRAARRWDRRPTNTGVIAAVRRSRSLPATRASALTTSGSNCVPECFLTSASAARAERPRR